MASKYAKDMLSLAILYSDEDSDFEDFFLFPESDKRWEKHAEQAERRARHGKRLDIATLPPDQCKSLFRYEKCDIPGLVEAIGFPQELEVIGNAVPVYRGVSALSVIINFILEFLYDKWHHLLDTLPAVWLTDARLRA